MVVGAPTIGGLNRIARNEKSGSFGMIIFPSSTGILGDLICPYAGKITGVEMLADQSGSMVVDIWKSTYSAYPPTIANTITASDLPTLSSAIKSQDNTLTGWTTSVSAGDVIRFNLNSYSTVTRVLLTLFITKS